MNQYVYLNNINWAHVPMEHVEHFEDFNKVLDDLESNGVQYLEIEDNKLITDYNRLWNRYFITFHKNGATVRAAYFDEAADKLNIKQIYVGTAEQIAPEVSGYRSFYKILAAFKRYYKEDFPVVFGGESARLWQRIKSCVPAPVNYAMESRRVLEHIYKADISASYATEGCKPLPTLQGCKKQRGKIAPTAEYPFVFYLKSHHLAIYKELDTREYKQYPLWYKLTYFESIPDSSETSLCCKAAPFSMAPIFTHYYEGRGEHPEYKQYMNLFVGYCHRVERPEYAHIAAVILARASMRILRYAKDIERAGNVVRLIATDSVLWQGEPVDFTATTKSLGCFLQEYSDTQAVVLGAKKYQILEPDGHTITRWAGVKRELYDSYKLGELLTSTHAPVAYMWNGRRFVTMKDEGGDYGEL